MLGTSLTLSQYLARTSAEFAGIETVPVERLAAEIHSAYEEGRFVFLCGNGGSGANASHICEDLAKSTLERADYSTLPCGNGRLHSSLMRSVMSDWS